MILTTTYHEVKVEFDTADSIYTVYAEDGAIEKQSKSIWVIEKWIDNPKSQDKKKKKAVRIPALLYEAWSDKYISCEITIGNCSVSQKPQ